MSDELEALLRQVIEKIEDEKVRCGRSDEGRRLAIMRTHAETALAIRIAGDRLP